VFDTCGINKLLTYLLTSHVHLFSPLATSAFIKFSVHPVRHSHHHDDDDDDAIIACRDTGVVTKLSSIRSHCCTRIFCCDNLNFLKYVSLEFNLCHTNY